MEYCIALFISRREGFFKEKACINCSVDEYCACDDADQLFDVDSVMREKLIDIGRGVKMTEPLKVEKGLLTGNGIMGSISHKGILGIRNSDNTLQFTDLNNGKQVSMKVESYTIAAYYDDVIILLTDNKPLREATVESVFNNPTIETFKVIEGAKNISLFPEYV